ncbi:MAG: DMT family transporter [Spirochaetales bacterium]|nr:DMT family transporter [Spirochaetales bacterium]
MSQTELTIHKLSVLIFGEILAVTSIYFVKSSTMNPMILSGARLLLASLLLLPLAMREYRDSGEPFRFKDVIPSLFPGLLLGFHFITWITGGRMIPSANATLIVNLTPAAMPFFLFLLTHERINRSEALGTGLVLMGSFILAYTDLQLGGDYFKGDMILFVSMLAMAAYPVFSKRSMKGTFSYLVPLYLTGSLLCFLTALLTGVDFTAPMTVNDWIALFGLGVVCTVGGHSIMNWSMKHMRGQIVSLFHTTQFFFAGIIGYIAFKEIPGRNFFISTVVILCGLIISITARSRRKLT